MSRIIVKQLPKNITEEKLRSLFGSKGTITDLQLKYTPDGKFRQFCFIGYRSEDEAQAAVKFFDNTCIQTSRIRVETCAALGGEEKPQSWSKYAKDSKKSQTATTKTTDKLDENDIKNSKKKTSKLNEIIGDHKDDPEFQEFMKVHDRNRTLWANDADMIKEQQKNTQTEDAVNEVNETDTYADSGVVDEDEDDVDDVESDSSVESATEKEKLAEKPISDLDYMKSLMGASTKSPKKTEKTPKTSTKQKNKDSLELYTIKIHNVPYKAKRQDVLKFFKPLKPYSVRLPSKVHGFCYVGFKTEKEMGKAMLKNKSFIKGKQVFFTDFTEQNKVSKSKSNEANENAELAPTHAKWAKQQADVHTAEDISDSGKIFFRNLAYTITEDDLQKLFEKFGPVAEIHLPVDTITRQIKGFGTVTFMMPEHAVQAFNKLDGTDFHGRLLHLIPGKSKDGDNDETTENEAGLSFKQKKALKLKKTAQQSITWNSLFLGANAVADILAKQFETSKEKILDTSEGGSNAAVRIALGETQIVIEMKRFLEENGVHLAAFEASNKNKRSKTVILAKNLPAETSVADLTPIFAKFGPIGRIVLPPSGVTALIEYCDPSEARQAFKKLAYSRFKNAPLFLEWAPEHVFTTTLNGETIIPKQETVAKDESAKTDVSKETQSTEEEPQKSGDEEDELASMEPEPSTTLFLRNLNFKTVQETIYNHFKRLGPIHTVEIAKRKDQQNPRHTNSLGYGFIQFKLAATADQALKQMQFTNIDGNQVELKRSDRILKTNDSAGQRKSVKLTKQTGSKILVRNIPFQAKVYEVRELFKAFGELRSVRLPMKMVPGESTHRGFGFVDFVTKSDAKKAFGALSQSTHLYGRRLVLEWASLDDEDVTELRKRTAESFQSNSMGSNSAKSMKKGVLDVADKMLTSGGDDENE